MIYKAHHLNKKDPKEISKYYLNLLEAYYLFTIINTIGKTFK